MAHRRRHRERHVVGRLGWLRASVLGANDGLLSTSSLILGVASAHASHENVLIAGVSGVVAGAISMAAGEYVSVSSQSDSERADIGRERRELSENRGDEQQELAKIYIERGLDGALAMQVADRLMAHDALGAHAGEELGYPRRRERALSRGLSRLAQRSRSAQFFRCSWLLQLPTTCLFGWSRSRLCFVSPCSALSRPEPAGPVSGRRRSAFFFGARLRWR